jgi:ketosteroid isomerase-like protein
VVTSRNVDMSLNATAVAGVVGIAVVAVLVAMPRVPRRAARPLAHMIATDTSSGDSTQDQATIHRLENEWLTAQNSGDTATILRLLADDFERPVPAAGRFVNRSEIADFYRSHPRPPRPHAASRFESLSVRLYGDIALAHGVVAGTDSAGKPTRTLFVDVFARRNGSWRAVSAQENPITAR